MLAGGGARGAYQAGVLRGIAKHLPDLRFSVLHGVSAGAINIAFLAAHPGGLAAAAEGLCNIWLRLHSGDIFRADAPSLAYQFARWVARLASGGAPNAPEVRGLVDIHPLRHLIENATPTVDGELVGIAHNLEQGRLDAVAITTLNYTTGQTVTWVQRPPEVKDQLWERLRQVSYPARLTVDHVLASAALPLFFPAIRLGEDWHGDGGVRLDAPLSAPLHLGARRILAVSPRYEQSRRESNSKKTIGYPPIAQILSQLMNAIFLDVIDRDVRTFKAFNQIIHDLPPEKRGNLRAVDIVVLRPSQDLGRLAAEYEDRQPPAFRYLTRSLGTRETSMPDFLSLVLFEPEYMSELIALGERDAEANIEEIKRLADGAGA